MGSRKRFMSNHLRTYQYPKVLNAKEIQAEFRNPNEDDSSAKNVL